MKRILLFIVLFFITTICFALEETEKLWLGVNSQQVLSKDEKWLSFIFSQLRMANQDHPVQTMLLEGGIGRRFPADTTVWMGYRWSGHNPYNDFYEENLFFEQLIKQINPQNLKNIVFRTRLEELQRTTSNEISVRLRERVSFNWSNSLFFSKLFPLVYDELFFQLNRTNYSVQQLFSQNRFFLGFTFQRTEKNWWEIGYINQYQIQTPQNNENQMNHIISVIYNFT